MRLFFNKKIKLSHWYLIPHIHTWSNRILKYYLIPFFIHEYIFVNKHRRELSEFMHEGEKIVYGLESCSFVWLSAWFNA